MTDKFKAAWYTPSVRAGRTVESVMQMVRKTLEENKTKLEIQIMPMQELARIEELEETLRSIMKHYEHPMHDHCWAHYTFELAKKALESSNE